MRSRTRGGARNCQSEGRRGLGRASARNRATPSGREPTRYYRDTLFRLRAVLRVAVGVSALRMLRQLALWLWLWV